MKKYDIEEYVTENGKTPFSEWAEGLKDKTAQRKISQRIDRASLGNFGDYKSIKGSKGIFEMREHYGSGYRIFLQYYRKQDCFAIGWFYKKRPE